MFEQTDLTKILVLQCFCLQIKTIGQVLLVGGVIPKIKLDEIKHKSSIVSYCQNIND